MTEKDRTHASARAVAFAAAVATAGVLPVFLVGALAVQLRADLGFTAGGLGVAVAVYFGAAAIGSTTGGHMAERLGPARAMRVAAAIAAATLALAAASPGFEWLLACLVIAGIANAIAQPATNLFLAREIHAGRLGLAIGIKQSAIPAAAFLAGVAVPAIGLTVGWRWAFAGAGAAVGGLALFGRAAAGGPSVRYAGSRRTSDDTALWPLVVLAAGAGLGAAAAGTLGSFLVSASVDAGIGEGRAGILLSTAGAAGLATRVFAGWRADRRGGRHLVTVVTMLVGGTAGYALLATEIPMLVMIGAITGFCLGWGWNGLFTLSIVRNNRAAPGAATGITQTGLYLGAVLGPLLFGVVVDAASYRAAWSGSAVCSLLAAGTIALGRRLLLRDSERRAPAVAAASSDGRRLST